jgi:plastocyanin
MRKLTLLLALAAVVAAIAAASAFASTKVSWHKHSVTTVKVGKGGTVKWVWTDGETHNVKGSGFRSRTASKKGTSYSHTFSKRGTFKIICEVHPTNMITKVKVG